MFRISGDLKKVGKCELNTIENFIGETMEDIHYMWLHVRVHSTGCLFSSETL